MRDLTPPLPDIHDVRQLLHLTGVDATVALARCWLALLLVAAGGAIVAASAGAGQRTLPGTVGAIAYTAAIPHGLEDLLPHASGPPNDTAICLADPATRATRRVTSTSTGVESQPAWSPDGSRLAVKQTGSFDTGIEIVDLDGKPVLSRFFPTVSGQAHPAWSPDGKEIAFSSSAGLMIGPSDGLGAARRVATNASSPDWSPDGSPLAVVNDQSRVGLLPPTGGALQIVGPAFASSPSWSPDASRLAFAVEVPSGTAGERSWQVETMQRDGSGVAVLARVRLEESVDPRPVWSPDGTEVAFVADGPPFEIEGHAPGLEQTDIEAVSAHGGPVRPLAASPLSEQDPAWGSSPLGRTARPCTTTGTGRADKLNGSAFGDRIFGLAGNDTINAQAGDDIVWSGSGNDTVNGGAGNDRIAGGDGNDRISGGTGNDVLYGGSGRNLILGGPGNDSIHARNHQHDTVDCGPGRDTAYVDRIDSVKGCERVQRAR
jgi:dipeptidyl aminopeptidase/acylaminoacyl peptidase